MNFKKVISAALSAAITAGAMLAGTAFAAEQITSYDLSSHTTAASEKSQDIVISSEFKVHLNGNSETSKADSISNGEINFYRDADGGTNTPTGYIVFTPTNSGTLALNLKSSNNASKNGARLYAKEVENTIEATLLNCTKNNGQYLAQGKTASSNNPATDYLTTATTIGANNQPYTFKGGKTYILYPFTYNRDATLSFKDFTYTYTAEQPKAVLGEYQTFSESEGYEGNATAVKFTVNPNGYTVSNISVKYKEETRTVTTPALSGNGTILCGIIVPEILDSIDNVFTITVNDNAEGGNE